MKSNIFEDIYNDKTILFSVQKMEGYKETLEIELSKKFKRVEFIESEYLSSKDRSLYNKLVRNLNLKFKSKKISDLYQELIEKTYKKKIDSYQGKFDYFLVISGGDFSVNFLKKLREKNPKIKCILFLWDNITKYYDYFKEYDYIFTIEKEDAIKYDLIFRPSFYINNVLEKSIEFRKRKIDLSYIGKLREMERYTLIEKFNNYCKRNELKSYLKLYLGKGDNGVYDSDLVFKKKIKYIKNLEYSVNSKVIIEVNYPGQKGLTLRSMESIGAEIKLITTNQDVKNYDFYDEENILIIKDSKDVDKIDKSFFLKEYKKIAENIKKRYSAKGFIEEIFNYVSSEN